MKKLPPADEIRKNVEILISKYTTAVQTDINNYQEVLNDVRDTFGALITTTQTRPLEQWYLRARTGNFDLTDPTQFTYPPSEYTRYGRCNLEKHPVFYGGEHAIVAINEIGADIGQKLFLSAWRSNDHYPKYAMFGYREDANAARMKAHAESRLESMREQLKYEPDEFVESAVELQKAMSQLFTSDMWSISAALSHQAIYIDGYDGVEYPDSKTRETYNFALSTDYASRLNLHRVWECKKMGEKEVRFCRIGIPNRDNDKVDWRAIVSKDELPNNDAEMGFTKIIGDDWQFRGSPQTE